LEGLLNKKNRKEEEEEEEEEEDKSLSMYFLQFHYRHNC